MATFDERDDYLLAKKKSNYLLSFLGLFLISLINHHFIFSLLGLFHLLRILLRPKCKNNKTIFFNPFRLDCIGFDRCNIFLGRIL